MKRIFTLIAASLFAGAAFAQVQIGDREETRTTIGKTVMDDNYLIRVEREGDTVYALGYRNDYYESIEQTEQVTFSATKQDIIAIRDMLLSCFDKENRKNKEFKKSLRLGEVDFYVQPAKDMFFNAVLLWVDGYNFAYLSRVEVEVMFGGIESVK